MTRKNDKAENLRKLGTLNRRPERVNDPRFLSDPFFDPRDLVQVRCEMLRRVSREGQSVSESARNFGVSRPTWYHAARAFEESGLAGLVPERPGPRRAHKLDDTVVEALAEARRAAPGATTAELVALARSRFGISVHRRSVERALDRAKKNAEPDTGAARLSAAAGRGLRTPAPHQERQGRRAQRAGRADPPGHGRVVRRPRRRAARAGPRRGTRPQSRAGTAR